MKRFLAILGIAALLAGSIPVLAQTNQYTTVTVAGTADVLIDSTLTAAIMKGKRVHINGIYAWWDNAANTNQVFIQVVRGTSALREQGVRRQFLYSEAMASAGIKGVSFPDVNVTAGPDSAIYFVINAASSDSLFLAVNYKLIYD